MDKKTFKLWQITDEGKLKKLINKKPPNTMKTRKKNRKLLVHLIF